MQARVVGFGLLPPLPFATQLFFKGLGFGGSPVGPTVGHFKFVLELGAFGHEAFDFAFGAVEVVRNLVVAIFVVSFIGSESFNIGFKVIAASLGCFKFLLKGGVFLDKLPVADLLFFVFGLESSFINLQFFDGIRVGVFFIFRVTTPLYLNSEAT